MRRRLAVIAPLALVMMLAVPGPAAVSAVGPDLSPRVVATLPSGPFGSFGESLAARGGNLYVSLTTWSPDEVTPNVGQVWKIAPNGKLTRFGPSLDVCILTGLAFDDLGRLYVGTYSCDATFALPSGVIRINADGTSTRILTLPAGSFPNGLAFHDGDLYVSDFATGAIWRVRPQGDSSFAPTTPWLQTSLLAPQKGSALGANGIAFWGDTLYAVTYFGSVVRVAVRTDGTPGTPSVFARDHRLLESDGVAFDSMGRLWIAVNTGLLARVDLDGSVSVLLKDPAWLDYPAQPAFGTTARDAATLYVVNGSFNIGTPNVIALQVGVTGNRLP